jgi:hypothetical protein
MRSRFRLLTAYDLSMPVIVVGADTAHGAAVIESLSGRNGEIRAFISDPATADDLRSLGCKVAIGDVTDTSHVGGAAVGCFSAVLVSDALFDGRERSFASSAHDAAEGWCAALVEAQVQRVMWIENSRLHDAIDLFAKAVPEAAAVASRGRTASEIATEIARIDNLASLPEA